jgi:integrase/recombinase XerD
MKEAITKFKIYLEQRYPERSTAKHYVSDLLIFSQFVGQVNPKEITPKMIDQFVQAQSQQGLKASTINRRLASLSSLFAFLIDASGDEQWHNPVRWKRHGIKPGRHLPRDVSDETVRRLFALIDDMRDRAIFTLMLSAGLRVGEVVQLRVQDLPSLETTILSRLRVCGKGDKERIAWLTTEAMRPVQTWLEQRAQSQENHLFLNQHGRPLSVSGVQYRLRQYCQQAQVQVTCHQLRHTFARRLAEHNMPLDSLAKLLGHRSLQTTQLYIDGADPTVRRDFLAAMESTQVLNSALSSSATVPVFNSVSQCNDERPDPVAIVDNLSHLAAQLPDWLQQAIRDHTRRCISGWQPHQAHLNAHNHFAGLCRIGHWLVEHRYWSSVEQLQRADLVAYVQACQSRGLKPQSIGVELKRFRRFWRDLLAQERVSNGAILLVKAPPATSDPLPRYLTPVEFQRLAQVVLTETQAERPPDHFNRTWFYLLAHAGLRRAELLNLRLSDCDLDGRRLRVQGGKGNRDRVLPMTQQLAAVLSHYLTVRESAATDHVLIHKGAPVGRFLIAYRLDHQDINKTLIYARVHDETVQQHFAAAIAQIEGIPVSDWPQQVDQLDPSLLSTAAEGSDSV